MSNPKSENASQSPSLKVLAHRIVEDLAQALFLEVQALDLPKGMDLEQGIRMNDEVRRYETSLIQRALRITRGHQRRAAQLLGVNATTLNAKMKRYNISSELTD